MLYSCTCSRRRLRSIASLLFVLVPVRHGALGALFQSGRCMAVDTPGSAADRHTLKPPVLLQLKKELQLSEDASEGASTDKSTWGPVGDHVKVDVDIPLPDDASRVNPIVDAIPGSDHIPDFLRPTRPPLESNAARVATAIQSGINAIMQATVHFAAEPPRIADGITTLGQGFLAGINTMLSEEGKKTEDNDEFEEAWQAAYDDIPGSVEGVEANIQDYIWTGNAAPLLSAVGKIIANSTTIATLYMDSETSAMVTPYLQAVHLAFEAMSLSWDEFAQGRTAGGIEAAYKGVRGATGLLLPEAVQDDDVYNGILGALDGTLGDLSRNVLDYERRMMEATVCYRQEKDRGRQRPSVCPDDYVWDQHAYCHFKVAAKPGPSAALLQARSSGSVVGAIPARCDEDSDFPEKHDDHWCYEVCGSGFQVTESDLGKCISACEGNFSAESANMCGRDRGMLMKTVMEMVTVPLNAGFTLVGTITVLAQGDVDASAIASTIQVFIDMGKPFANPTCPVPAPTPAPAAVADICTNECTVGPPPGHCRVLSGGMTICVPAMNGTCAKGQTSCMPSSQRRRRTVVRERPACIMDEPVFISSHRGEQLADAWGTARISSNKDTWESFTLSDAGQGHVYITSHRGERLSDHNGHVKYSPNHDTWEQWMLTYVGNGEVYITSHRHQQLQDHNGNAELSWNGNDWEKWKLTSSDGQDACSRSTTTTTTRMACADNPSDFADSFGMDCIDYASNDWCSDGGYGPEWLSEYGQFADFAHEGLSAADACCLCGGGARESINSSNATSCVDNHDGAILAAEQMGHQIGGCSEFGAYCDDVNYGTTIREFCPQTCGSCGKDTPSFPTSSPTASPTASAAAVPIVSTSTDTTSITTSKHSQACSDNSEGAIAVAEQMGRQIGGCADVASYCDDDTLGEVIQRLCPLSCGLCNGDQIITTTTSPRNIIPSARPTGAPTTSPTAVPTASPTAAPTVSPTVAPTIRPACLDRADYRDRDGQPCSEYKKHGWCANAGYGPQWWFGTFDDFAEDGVSPGDACCACGGGV